jgi:hypothetical protein
MDWENPVATDRSHAVQCGWPESSHSRNRLVTTNTVFHRSTIMERTMERSSHSKKDPVFHCYMRTRGYCPVNGMV